MKISNHGWSINERYFKMDKQAVSYFSDTSTKVVAKVHSNKQKPKQSVPMMYVTELGPLITDLTRTPNDCEEVKKFKTAYDTTKAFKIVFYSAALIDGPYMPEKFIKTPDKVKMSGYKTWYLLISQ